jgi:multiple sugar transport system permease protein
MIGYFQLFAEPYVMTQGGPVGATRSIVLLMYEEGFRWWRMGVASTIAVLLLLITLIGALVQMRLRPGREATRRDAPAQPADREVRRAG